jgi:MFS family permease
MQSQTSLPLAMREHHIGSETYGTLVAMNGVLIIVLQPLVARAMRRVELRVLLASGAVLCGLGFGANAIATTVPHYLGGIVLWTLGELAFSAAAPAFVADIAPVHARGVYQGAHHMLWGAAFAIAPLIGTATMQAFGAEALWLSCLIASLVAALAHGRLRVAQAK